ncbi:MAG TPA: 4-(cytidine 5'-diphospho)-2-C-methyl-D-erythritol kinase [Verrucomicrobiae bacterium]|nr:4-(cytidine 5'-diphospho)-2-C-methyl-D-erythritol kinase [Verrucomicrobiae bacterium]
MTLENQSPCKINLLLNILGKRADGFHELETVMHPVRVFDELRFAKSARGVQLSCSEPALPTDSGNLVFRAASAFLEKAGIADGVRIHLQKNIPLAAGLGGGSGNAATTLLGLNELFGNPLSAAQLHEIAAVLGSDIPFFLQSKPALATGRGEKIQPLDFFPALACATLILIHPGFGISTAWAYQSLPKFPAAFNGERGRAEKLISALRNSNLRDAAAGFYNSLEAPALEKYPILALYQQFLRENGAAVALMSGSGSTTFALIEKNGLAENIAEKFKSRFGETCWIKIVPL